MQERCATGAKGRNWLFFGDQGFATGFHVSPRCTKLSKPLAGEPPSKPRFNRLPSQCRIPQRRRNRRWPSGSAAHLNKRLQLDQPIDIHLAGCPNSFAQHYIGDIGLQGVKVNAAGSSVEVATSYLAAAMARTRQIGREVFKGISFAEMPKLLEHVLKIYQAGRHAGESFAVFTRRHDVKQLQEMFST